MKNKKLSYKVAARCAAVLFIITGILIWFSQSFGSSVFTHVGERESVDLQYNEWERIIDFVGTFLYLFILFTLNFKILESRIKGRKRSFVAFFATIAAAFIFNVLMLLVMNIFATVEFSLWIGTIIKDLVWAIIVFFLSQIIYLSAKKQQMDIEYEMMKAENANSRFEALKNQLDPHFMFNTFNALDSLIEEDPETARDYLHKLSSVFRYIMPNKDHTTLEEELIFTRSYNELMQLRYEDSLVFEFNIDEQYLCYEIVPLSIQTLIENAIKHNVISSESPFVIRVDVGPEPTVTVSNLIRVKKTPQIGSGIGLSNLTERFRLKFQKEISISNTDGVFSVTLPLHSPEDDRTL